MQQMNNASALNNHVQQQYMHANGLPMINLAASTTLLPVEYSTTGLSLTPSIVTRANADSLATSSGLYLTGRIAAGQKMNHHEMEKNEQQGGLFGAQRTISMSEFPSQLIPPPPMIERQSKTNLYIKGLPENFTDEALEKLVPDKSKIKSLKAALEDDYRCKGYGFIDFVTEEDAKRALDFIQSHNPHFNAKYAKENEKDKTNLYITNIPKEWTSKDSDKLKVFFEKYGAIQSAFIMIEKSTNKTVGVGFVRFVHESDALKALEQLEKGQDYLPNCDRPIEAKYADKHNPETRKRRNPSSMIASPNSAATSLIAGGNNPHLESYTAAALNAVRSVGAGSAAMNLNLINPNVPLTNSLYATPYALQSQTPLMIRNTLLSQPSPLMTGSTATAANLATDPYFAAELAATLYSTSHHPQQPGGPQQPHPNNYLYHQLLALSPHTLDQNLIFPPITTPTAVASLNGTGPSTTNSTSISSSSTIDLYSYSQLFNNTNPKLNNSNTPTNYYNTIE